MTIDDMLTQAVTAFRAGQLAEAERQFKAVLAQQPQHLAGLNLLGMVLTAARKFDEAEQTIRAAIAVNANSDATHHNHGVVLKELGRPAEALAAIDKALAINPAVANSWSLRGTVLNELKRSQEAAESFDRAIGLQPNLAEAWVGLAGILSLAKQSEDALTAYDRALALNPNLPAAWLGRALSLAQMKRIPEAVAAYRDAAAHGVDAEQVNFHLAAIGAAPAPAAPVSANIAMVFDQYAETFDQHLTEGLKYNIPAEAAAAVKRFTTQGKLDILDLGCGTGLVGEQLASLKRRMLGIDLSAKMLEKARQRGIYEELICDELIRFLDTQTAIYDVVVAADVFIYLGDLAPVFRGVRRALKDGGVFCFSIEEAEQDFVVRESFRFAHSVAYIRRLAQQNGFSVQEMEPVIIRQDEAAKIGGYLAVLR
ncbi:MAG: tetratricopeptide repeat protein [Pseudolabrys sp.]|nr:tetratricopeptide repeat protein [Pseudolabrys sp.]